MQARNAEGSRDRFYADIPQWQEIFDNPTGHPLQENQMPTTQISSQIYLAADQHQPQQEQQYLQSLSSCAFSPSSQLPSSMQNEISFQNQLPVYSAANQQHDQHLQQRLEQNNLPSTQPYDFSASSQCASTIQYQSNLQRNIMPHILIEPQVRSNQTSVSLPTTALSSADLVAASLVDKHQYQEHIQRHLYPEQRQHQAPPLTAPLIRPHSSIRKKKRQLSCRTENVETQILRKNFARRMANADPEQKKNFEKMRELISFLKKSRIELDLSQTGLSLEMSKHMEIPITQYIIQSLEEFTMGVDRMWTFKPIIERWLEEKVWLGKEPPTITSELSVNAEITSDLPQDTQATISTTNAYVLEDDVQQKKEHGTEDIVFLGKWLTTEKRNVTNLSENCFQKEKNLIHNPNISTMPHYPSVRNPVTTPNVSQLHHDRPSQRTPINLQHTSFPSHND